MSLCHCDIALDGFLLPSFLRFSFVDGVGARSRQKCVLDSSRSISSSSTTTTTTTTTFCAAEPSPHCDTRLTTTDDDGFLEGIKSWKADGNSMRTSWASLTRDPFRYCAVRHPHTERRPREPRQPNQEPLPSQNCAQDAAVAFASILDVPVRRAHWSAVPGAPNRLLLQRLYRAGTKTV